MEILRPSITKGIYPERNEKDDALFFWPEAALTAFRQKKQWIKDFSCYLPKIREHGVEFATLDTAGRQQRLDELRRKLHATGVTPENTAEAFGIIQEVSYNVMGMRHFDCQLYGGWILINGGLAEMETGEGKTLTATLAAATAALAGIPTQVITANDYLAHRDAKLMTPLYHALDLSVTTAASDMLADNRRNAYQNDITYCTGKQLAFDYLRDRILLGKRHGKLRMQLDKLYYSDQISGQLFLRGLCFAIVDEADNVLIDEAKTPLIIAREKSSSKDDAQIYLQAVKIAQELRSGVDFTIDKNLNRVELSDMLETRLKTPPIVLGGVWANKRLREELIRKALSALYIYQRDYHYLIQDGQVIIIDENTGRVLKDRSWERGLHQMIEIKEGCTLTSEKEHVARLTYQRFFRRYLRLSGMTGTAREASLELLSIYRLPVVTIPPNKPVKRKLSGHHIFSTKHHKWLAASKRTLVLYQQNRPVLIGTRSVSDSEQISQMLSALTIDHQVLNARQDLHEAEVVARAGAAGAVTVATNMAGRGTDIPLAPGIEELGGLHVISMESNNSARIDRQLYGRCGRQGEEGSYETFNSVEDELFTNLLPPWLISFFRIIIESKLPGTQAFGLLFLSLAQFHRKHRDRQMRRNLARIEDSIDELTSFSGKMN